MVRLLIRINAHLLFIVVYFQLLETFCMYDLRTILNYPFVIISVSEER